MAHQSVKPLIDFGDPEQCTGDSPCSLCLHTYPEWELLCCDQCTQRVHSICWIFLRDAFQDPDKWPCVSCQLPVDSAIELALRGSVASNDDATAEVLKRRVFVARQAMNQARWAVAMGSSKSEAMQTALQIVRQAISLQYTEQPETPQPSIAQQKGGALSPSPNSLVGSQISYTSTLSSRTGRKHNHQSSQVDSVQQAVSGHLVQFQQILSPDYPFQTRTHTPPRIEAHSRLGRHRPTFSTSETKKEIDSFGEEQMLQTPPTASTVQYLTPHLDTSGIPRYQPSQQIRAPRP